MNVNEKKFEASKKLILAIGTALLTGTTGCIKPLPEPMNRPKQGIEQKIEYKVTRLPWPSFEVWKYVNEKKQHFPAFTCLYNITQSVCKLDINNKTKLIDDYCDKVVDAMDVKGRITKRHDPDADKFKFKILDYIYKNYWERMDIAEPFSKIEGLQDFINRHYPYCLEGYIRDDLDKLLWPF